MWWKSKITVAQLQQEMTGTTGVFGRDKSVRVTFDGNAPVSEDGHVQFPRMDLGIELDQATARLFRGWVDSESALFRYADMSFFSKKKPLAEKQPLLYSLFKAVELARVEKDYAEMYPGSVKNLSQLAVEQKEFCWRKGLKDHELYPSALTMVSRSRFDGAYLDWDLRGYEERLDLEMVRGWVDKAEHLSSTKESFELAEKILKQIEKEHPEEDVDKPNSSAGDGEGEEGEGQWVFADPGTDVVSDKVRSAVAEVKYEKGEGPYLVLTQEFDGVKHWRDGGWSEDVQHYINTRDSFAADLAVAKKKLELLIRSTQRIAWDPLKERGKMDSKRLVAAYQADPYVFKLKDDASDLNTAVSVSVDLSGSMNDGERAPMAMATVIILSELLDKIGVPFEVSGYDAHFCSGCLGRAHEHNSSHPTKNADYDFARTEALRTNMFKAFNDRLFDARKYFWRIGNCTGAGHNNVDGESIQIAADSLMKRPEKRKILFVLSDGNPNGRGLVRPKFTHLYKTVLDLRKKQIEVIGVGIETSDPAKFYPEFVLVEDSQNLPVAMLDLMKKHLLPQTSKQKERKVA